VDDTWTYGVLSVEGFLPGYGLDLHSDDEDEEA
jgi:hypothetical protein